MFEQLRLLALEVVSANEHELRGRTDLVPIEKVEDGWVCFAQTGEVGLLDANGTFDPRVEFLVTKVALIGSLAQRVPLATWFIPKPRDVAPCPSCHGRGRVRNVPPELARMVRCQCGGLGWIPR
jgi:hypothetical protein